MGDQKTVQVQIVSEESGDLTYKEKQAGEEDWVEIKLPGLFVDSDHAAFYQKVALRLAEHAKNGVVVESYEDRGPAL